MNAARSTLLGAALLALGFFAWRWKTRDPEPAPVIPVPATRTNSPISLPAVPAKSTTEPDASAAPLTDPCAAPNAHEAWFAMKGQWKADTISRNFFFEARSGRTLLLRQERKIRDQRPYVSVTATWYDRANGFESVAKELNNEADFLELPELVELAGPAWMGDITRPDHPFVDELLLSVNEGRGKAIMRNSVVQELELTLENKKQLSCPKDTPCSCSP